MESDGLPNGPEPPLKSPDLGHPVRLRLSWAGAGGRRLAKEPAVVFIEPMPGHLVLPHHPELGWSPCGAGRASVLGRDPASFLWGGVADGAAGRWCQEAHDVWLAQCMRVFLNANSFSGAHVLQVAPVSPPSHLFTRTCCCSIFCLISWHSFLLLALQEPLINTNPKILMSYRQGNRGK